MRPIDRCFIVAGGLLLFALLCVALAAPKHFNPHGATIVVTNTNDSGPGSLRQAIADANDNDTIQFDPALNGQAITLTSSELIIDKSITISGPGQGLLSVSRDQQAPLFRIFHVIAGTTSSIAGLTITGGAAPDQRGGGILNEGGTLSVANCNIHANFSFGGVGSTGGGIFNSFSGTLTITESTISNNATLRGGGVDNRGQMHISNSTIAGNHAYQVRQGGGTAGGVGNSGTLTITDSVLTGNVAGEPNPFPTPVPSVTPLNLGAAGGISNGGDLTIQHSIITGNIATGGLGQGGGIYDGGSMTIIESTISNNLANVSGGGIYVTQFGTTAPVITGSTISGNSANASWGGGGGINNQRPVSIENSTLSGNAGILGGGISAGGGGMMTHCTLNANSIDVGSVGLQVSHTILNAAPIGGIGNITSHGYNLSSDDARGSLTGPGDQINTDPRLGPLQNNGGPTFTHELLADSPAINAGDPNFTPPPLYDQRGIGFDRVSNGRVDTGSFEAQGGKPTPTATSTSTATATATSTATPTVVPTLTPCADAPTVFVEDFDGVTAPGLPTDWSAVNASGPPPLWVTSTTTPDTPPNAAFIDDPGSVSDKRLDTPTIFMPFNTGGPYMTFRHRYNLENTFDGAVLEISTSSVNGGAFTDITDPAVGGGFLSGGYNAVISTSFMSPIAGRMAWSGDSGGYINTSVSLGPHVFGPSIFKLRFRMASDNSMSATGWRVDNVRAGASYFCETPTPTPTPFTPSPTPTATIPPPTATPIATPCGLTFSENYDGVTAPAMPSAWTTVVTGYGRAWETSTTFPTSGANEAFAYAVWFIGTGELITPAIAAPPSGILSFQNLFNLQAELPPSVVGYDGMVLEISINGGSYTDIIAAGGSFVSGGYTHTITGGTSSPIAGRMAWSGVSAGSEAAPAYITTTVNLPATANGQNIQLKWRLASDNTPDFNSPPHGVRIDSIILTPVNCGRARTLNLSTRMLVQTGDNVGIGGFIITGADPKQVLVRAIGPSLSQFGVPNTLADPIMELHGSAPFTTMTNDNWRDTQEAEIMATGIAPTNDLESAILATVEPGNYTAVVRGVGNATGVSLVEVYDLGPTTSQLGNISTRAFVGTDDDVAIGGFILGGGDSSATIRIRGLGPSLGQFGVPNPLADPTLELRDNNGVLLAASDNCGTFPPIASYASKDGPVPINNCQGSSCPGPLESCIDISLPPGAFTAILAGKNGGTGNGLVEIYNLNPTSIATPTPTATGTPTPPPPTPTITPIQCGNYTFLNQHFNTLGLPSGWASSFNSGPAGCSAAGKCEFNTHWAITNSNPNSPPYCAFHTAQICVTDSSLYSPSFYPIAGSVLTFEHDYNLQNGRDGAVLEISIAGGPFIDFVAAGGSFVGGSEYNGTISTAFQSPIAGRAAWTGNSGEYRSAQATMPAAAGGGQRVVLRFRLATDCSGISEGWYVDDVKVAFLVPCSTPTPSPASLNR